MTEKKITLNTSLVESMAEAKKRVEAAEKSVEDSHKELDASCLAVIELEYEINADESLCSVLMSTGIVVSDNSVLFMDGEGNIKSKPFVKIPYLWELK